MGRFQKPGQVRRPASETLILQPAEDRLADQRTFRWPSLYIVSCKFPDRMFNLNRAATMEKIKIHVHFSIISLLILTESIWHLIPHLPYDDPTGTKLLFGVQ
jgi:hypothetical protein